MGAKQTKTSVRLLTDRREANSKSLLRQKLSTEPQPLVQYEQNKVQQELEQNGGGLTNLHDQVLAGLENWKSNDRQIKENSIVKLSQIAVKNDENKETHAEYLFGENGLFDAFLSAAKDGETHIIESSGLEGLQNLAWAKSEQMSQHAGVVDALLSEAQTGATSEIKERALTGLAYLAWGKPEEVFTHTGIVDALLKAAQLGATNGVKRAGINGLSNLASKLPGQMIVYPGIVDTFLKATQSGATDGIKALGLNGLSTFTQEEPAKMFEHPGVVDAIVNAAHLAVTNDVKEESLRCLNDICQLKEQNLFEYPGVVDAFLRAAQTGATNKIKDLALHGLAQIAFGNSQKMYDYPGVLTVFVKAAQNGATDDLKAQGLRGLANLARAKNVQPKLFEEHRIMETVLKAISVAGTNDGALNVVWNISDHPYVADGLAEKYDLLKILYANRENTYDIPSIYMNLAVAPSARQMLLQNQEALNVIEEKARSANPSLAAISKLTLAILKGSDPKYLKADRSLLQTTLEILDGTLKGENVLRVAWPFAQPLLALRYLTTQDENRALLGTDWLVWLSKAIENGLASDDSAAVEYAISCLSQYALDHATLGSVKDLSNLTSIIRKVLNQKKLDPTWSGTINGAEGLLFTLEGGDHHVVTSSTAQGQVMISYAWGPPPFKNKELAAQVEVLKQKGYSVWRDEGMMKSNIMEAMAEAIATSQYVLVLVTKTYMESPNCKRELNFAINKKRKIVPLLAQPMYDNRTDGWLGVAIGELLYYDISATNNRVSVLNDMIQKELSSSLPVAATPTTSSPVTSVKFVPQTEDELREWGKSEIGEEAIQALIREKVVGKETLQELVLQPVPTIKDLLKLDNAGTALKLHAELSKLFN